MTDDQRQNNFADRLRRIEETRNAGKTEEERLTPTFLDPNFDYAPPKQKNPVRNTLIWVVFIAFIGALGVFGYGAIPQDLKNAVAELRTPEPPETNIDAAGVLATLSVQAIETATMSDQGPTIASPAVLNATGDRLTIIDVLSNIVVTNGDTPVGQVLPFERNVRCTLRPRLPTEKLVNVRVENALLTAPVQAFSNSQLVDHLLERVEAVTQDGQAFDLSGGITGQKTSLDVIVTDTSAPLYLVLQNMGPGVIWNIHPAPGVEIAHVAIISSGFSGVVSPPNNASYEALLVGDFVPPHSFGADDTVRECMIRPWRNPTEDWVGMIKAERGNTLYENQMYSYQKGYEAYNAWYTNTLGADASTNLITARDAAHVLVGPVPDEPVEYRTLDRRTIHMMRVDNVIVGDSLTRQVQADALHGQLLDAALGGDIALLNPAPVESPIQ